MLLFIYYFTNNFLKHNTTVERLKNVNIFFALNICCAPKYLSVTAGICKVFRVWQIIKTTIDVCRAYFRTIVQNFNRKYYSMRGY